MVTEADVSVLEETSMSQEKPAEVVAFEHLFPGNTWETLPRVNPLNVVTYIRELLLRNRIIAGQFARACKADKGFAYRISISHPDRTLMECEMRGMTPTEKIGRGAVADLLSEDEKVGGVAIRPVVIAGQDPEKRHEAQIIGVLDKKGKPAGLIWFRSGQRPEKGRPVPRPRSLRTPTRRLQPVPVEI